MVLCVVHNRPGPYILVCSSFPPRLVACPPLADSAPEKFRPRNEGQRARRFGRNVQHPDPRLCRLSQRSGRLRRQTLRLPAEAIDTAPTPDSQTNRARPYGQLQKMRSRHYSRISCEQNKRAVALRISFPIIETDIRTA